MATNHGPFRTVPRRSGRSLRGHGSRRIHMESGSFGFFMSGDVDFALASA
jgi:hypothetical protein